MSPLPLSARTLLCLLALLSLFSGGEGWAQEAPIRLGTGVRVWTQTDSAGQALGSPVEGKLAVLTSDSLVLDRGRRRGMSMIPLSSVSRVDVLRDLTRTEAVKKGTLVGALAGSLGVITPILIAHKVAFAGWELDYSAVYSVIALTTATGAAAGAFMGATFPRQLGKRWHRVAPDSVVMKVQE